MGLFWIKVRDRVGSVSLRDDHVGVEEDELADLGLVEATAPVHQDGARLGVESIAGRRRCHEAESLADHVEQTRVDGRAALPPLHARLLTWHQRLLEELANLTTPPRQTEISTS